MTTWQPGDQERRKMNDTDTDIQLIKKDIGYIKGFIESDRARSEKLLNDHVASDKYMFTTIIGLLLFILGKLFIK